MSLSSLVQLKRVSKRMEQRPQSKKNYQRRRKRKIGKGERRPRLQFITWILLRMSSGSGGLGYFQTNPERYPRRHNLNHSQLYMNHSIRSGSITPSTTLPPCQS